MKCPLTVMPEGQKCEIRESVSVLGDHQQVQQTCSTCGSGCGIKRTLDGKDIIDAPAVVASEAGPAANPNVDEPTDLEE